MTHERIDVEGASLEEALRRAAEQLGIERRMVAFEYDRAHLAAGASTVRIIARKKDPAELEREAAAQAEAPRPPSPGRREGRDGRDGGRGRDRGGRREGDRGGPRGRGGPDRPDRGDRGDRGERGERGGPREGHRPIKDPERDEALRQRARQIAERVLAGEGPLTLSDLNSYERHLVHTAVRDMDSGLVTQSLGEGLRKDVQIARAE
ncbi:MAG: hypothetical protein IT384_30425 [Deltaproteobacteria bacterium]|nr:hypothetical protein [Deltaproteobacteria bacterium]